MTERFPTLVQLGNAITVGDDGWAMLAPFGDHPGVAFTRDGRREAVQRVSRETGEALRKSLLSLKGKAARFFRSVPIFNGHPDVPAVADRFPDATVKGTVGDLQVREDGIYVRPVFNDAGADLVNSGERLGLSAYVDARVIGEEAGKLIAEWTTLRSVGMTPHPNLPVEMLNSQERGVDGAHNPEDPTMNTQALIAALSAAGIQIANATEDAVLAGVRALHERLTAAVTAANAKDGDLAGLKTERDGLKARTDELTTQLANEQDARRKDLLDERVTSGAITEAERALWDGRLKASFANESAALRALPAKVKTAAVLANAGERRANGTLAGTVQLINEAIAEVRTGQPGMSYQEAYTHVVRTKPELFSEVK